MQKGPRISSRRTKRALLRLGCDIARKNKGGHLVLVTPNGRTVAVPLSHPQIPRNVAWDFCRQAGIEWPAFWQEY